MVKFNAAILKFDEQGEKTGWTFIEVPADIARKLKPGHRKSFRVKGKLDSYAIKGVALLPMGGGIFIMPINAAMRKGLGKKQGATLQVQLEEDKAPLLLNPELMACLADEPAALEFFSQLAKSHQLYFSKWVESAKTDATRAKRITQTVIAMTRKQNYGEMIRANRGG